LDDGQGIVPSFMDNSSMNSNSSTDDIEDNEVEWCILNELDSNLNRNMEPEGTTNVEERELSGIHWSFDGQIKYIALSQAMREVLPIIWLMEEPRHQGIPVLNAMPKIHCKVFEDNAGAIEIANVPKMRPRTKHLSIKYHHFREEVKKGTICIYHTRTKSRLQILLPSPYLNNLLQSLGKR